jgi:NAD(P)-dependent dehydrogenase (short-subunit alcohol dehydrogenase family)
VTQDRRRALVTGASSGIGEAVCRLLASEGYRVALLARREERLEEVRGELAGDGHLVLPCDLSDPTAIERAFDKVATEFDGLDLVVNNAGLGYRARVEELDPELLRRVFDTNVCGLLLVCRAALPLLRKGGRGGHQPVVVNVSSVVGRRGIPGQAAYSASKAAVSSIGQALRVEWAEEGVAICTLSPGLTATGFFEAQANPQNLPDPDLATSQGPGDVAREVLALDRHPQPERFMRRKWQLLGLLTLVAPRWSDRILVRRLS